MIEDTGEIELSEADDSNIPVVCLLSPPDCDEKRWVWYASNFMPRKEYCHSGAYRLEADTKEEIVEAVRKHVVPLYEAALKNLKETGENYYWKAKDEMDTRTTPRV